MCIFDTHAYGLKYSNMCCYRTVTELAVFKYDTLWIKLNPLSTLTRSG